MTAPDFIVAGAMRAGSTALAQALGEHPGIFMTTPKEPSFFAIGSGALSFSGPGDQWFAAQHPRDWEAYQRLFRSADGAVTGEASAMYLSLPGVAKSIAGCRPDVKLVFVLRDPVARAHSAWLYLRGRGREDVTDFREALDAEQDRRRDGYGPMWWYEQASRYDQGLREYYEAFPRSSILVVTTEGLRGDPDGTLGRVYAFLGLPTPDGVSEALAREVNSGGEPRAPWLGRLLYPSDRLRRAASGVAPPPLRRLVQRARAASLRRPDPIPDDCRARLEERLGDVPAAVEALAGVDTSVWRTSQRDGRQLTRKPDDVPS